MQAWFPPEVVQVEKAVLRLLKRAWSSKDHVLAMDHLVVQAHLTSPQPTVNLISPQALLLRQT